MESKGKDANKQTNSSGEFDKTVKWQDNFTLKQTASESASKNTSSVSSDSVSKEDLNLLEKAGRIDQLVALGMQGNKLAIDALGRMNAVEGLCKVGNSSNAQAATHSMVVLFQMAGMNSDTTKKAAIEALKSIRDDAEPSLVENKGIARKLLSNLGIEPENSEEKKDE